MNKSIFTVFCVMGFVFCVALSVFAFKLAFSYFPEYALVFWDVISYTITPLLP